MIVFVSLTWERKVFPKPSPLDAPLTSPAMSTNSTIAGITFSGETNSANLFNLSSGTSTIPKFGSIVQKG